MNISPITRAIFHWFFSNRERNTHMKQIWRRNSTTSTSDMEQLQLAISNFPIYFSPSSPLSSFTFYKPSWQNIPVHAVVHLQPPEVGVPPFLHKLKPKPMPIWINVPMSPDKWVLRLRRRRRHPSTSSWCMRSRKPIVKIKHFISLFSFQESANMTKIEKQKQNDATSNSLSMNTSQSLFKN